MPRLLVVTPVHAGYCDHLPSTADSVVTVAEALRSRDVELAWSVCLDGAGAAYPPVSVETFQQHPSLLFGQSLEGVEVHLTALEGQWGPSVARNVALASADADWVFTLDADDVLVPEGVLAMCDELVHGWAWVSSSRLELDGSESRAVVPDRHEFIPGEVNATYRHPFMFHPNNVAYRTEVIVDAGGWPALPGGEDLALLLRVARSHAGVAVPSASVGYRRWESQITAGSSFATARTARYQVYARFDLLGGRDPQEVRAGSKSSTTWPNGQTTMP